jgi:hypothetical protein
MQERPQGKARRKQVESRLLMLLVLLYVLLPPSPTPRSLLPAPSLVIIPVNAPIGRDVVNMSRISANRI